MDRGSFRALAVTYLGAAFWVGGIGYASHSTLAAALMVFCAGFCVVGGQIAANALAAHYFPTPMRSTDVGWALGIGRIGSIVGPLIGGGLLSHRMRTEWPFLIAAMPAAGACLAAFAISPLGPVRGASRRP